MRKIWFSFLSVYHTVQTADLNLSLIRQIPQLHSWIKNKFMLRLLLCILGLFLPPNFTLSFHNPSSEGASVRIQSDALMKFFYQLLSRNKHTHLTLFIHNGLLSQLKKGIVNKFQNVESTPRFEPSFSTLSFYYLTSVPQLLVIQRVSFKNKSKKNRHLHIFFVWNSYSWSWFFHNASIFFFFHLHTLMIQIAKLRPKLK